MNFKAIFHYISYLQYLLMLISFYFVFNSYLFEIEKTNKNLDLIFQNLNTALIFYGLGVSFSSLQDTTKTQNKFSRKIWESPKKGIIAIITMSIGILLILVLGLTGYLNTTNGILKDLSVGLIVLSLGMFGFLKTAIEIFENHRKDKNIPAINIDDMQK